MATKAVRNWDHCGLVSFRDSSIAPGIRPSTPLSIPNARRPAGTCSLRCDHAVGIVVSMGLTLSWEFPSFGTKKITILGRTKSVQWLFNGFWSRAIPPWSGKIFGMCFFSLGFKLGCASQLVSGKNNPHIAGYIRHTTTGWGPPVVSWFINHDSPH